jgi:hypothetical protein
VGSVGVLIDAGCGGFAQRWLARLRVVQMIEIRE